MQRQGRQAVQSPAVTEEAQVLRRGLETFAELGYEATSVRELARRLGVSHNFINERYGSKADFWRAAVDFALLKFKEDVVPMLRGDAEDDIEYVRNALTHFYRFAARSPHLNRLVADESARESPRLDYLYEHYVGPSLQAVAPALDRLVATGQMAPNPLYLLYFTVTGAVTALSQRPLARRLGRPELAGEEDIAAAATALASVVLDGLLPASDR